MRRALSLSQLITAEQKVELAPGESNHLSSVLRLKEGDLVLLLDQKGAFAQARLFYHQKSFWAETLESPKKDSSKNHLPFSIAQSMIKGEAMEWVIEKAVELGAHEFFPILADHCVVQMKNKSPHAFQERWQKIADQSLKQCERLTRLEIQEPLSLDQFLKKQRGILLANEKNARENLPQNDLLQAYKIQAELFGESCFLVGPEGGWSDREQLLIEKHHAPMIINVDLGSLILRAETAAVCGMSLLAYSARQNTHSLIGNKTS